MIKYQPPAEGILMSGDYGHSRSYKIICKCNSEDHIHDLWVEADDTDVSINIYVTVKSQFWSLNRWKQMWQLLTKGYLQYETNLLLDQQSALNYSKTLEKAVEDVSQFKKKSKKVN